MKPDDAGPSARDQRRARLAASLRENLKRRKAQQRSRAAETASAGAENRAKPADDRAKTAADKGER